MPSFFWQNFFKFNSDKTEVLIIGPEHVSEQTQPLLCLLTLNIKSATKILSVILDSNLSLEQHVKKLVQLCFYQLRNISRIRSVLSFSNTERIIHLLYPPTLITVMSCLPAWLVKLWSSSKLFKIQQWEYWLLAIDYWVLEYSLTSHQSWLHCTGFQYLRIHFKVLLITYKALNDLAPEFITELLTLYCPYSPLRSASLGLWLFQSPGLKQKAIEPLQYWFLGIRSADSVTAFKSHFKTWTF